MGGLGLAGRPWAGAEGGLRDAFSSALRVASSSRVAKRVQTSSLQDKLNGGRVSHPSHALVADRGSFVTWGGFRV